jgi:hypothetical protein
LLFPTSDLRPPTYARERSAFRASLGRGAKVVATLRAEADAVTTPRAEDRAELKGREDGEEQGEEPMWQDKCVHQRARKIAPSEHTESCEPSGRPRPTRQTLRKLTETHDLRDTVGPVKAGRNRPVGRLVSSETEFNASAQATQRVPTEAILGIKSLDHVCTEVAPHPQCQRREAEEQREDGQDREQSPAEN